MARPKSTKATDPKPQEPLEETKPTDQLPTPTPEPGTVQAPATMPTVKAPMVLGARGIIPTSIESVGRIATMLLQSGLCPSGFKNVEAVCVGIAYGLELGVAPMTMMQNSCVINNRPSLFGDITLALIMATGELEDIKEYFTGKPYDDDYTAHCELTRTGYSTVHQTYSVADAKRAGLWGGVGKSKPQESPWYRNPGRQMQFRARHFAERDRFPNVLKGVRSVEIERDEARYRVDVTPDAAGPVIPDKVFDDMVDGVTASTHAETPPIDIDPCAVPGHPLVDNPDGPDGIEIDGGYGDTGPAPGLEQSNEPAREEEETEAEAAHKAEVAREEAEEPGIDIDDAESGNQGMLI